MKYGMFIIRPDGNNEAFYKLFCEYLRVNNIEIIDEKEVQFSQDDIKMYFYYKFPTYLDYMCSGKSKCIFVGSKYEDFHEKILKIKYAMREKCNVNRGDLKTLLHSSQNGTELYLQKKIFGEKFYEPKYIEGKDYCIKIASEREIPYIKRKLKETQIYEIALNVTENNLMKAIQWKKEIEAPNLKVGLAVSRKVLANNNIYELLYFLNCSKIEKIHGRVQIDKYCYSIGLGNVLNYNDINSEEVTSKKEYIKCVTKKFMTLFEPILKLKILDSIQLDSSIFSIEESEARGDIASEYNLKIFGGSTCINALGKFAVEYPYDDLEELELL